MARAIEKFFGEDLSGAFVKNIRESSFVFSWIPLVNALERFCSQSAGG
jgi:hypothetical protein